MKKRFGKLLLALGVLVVLAVVIVSRTDLRQSKAGPGGVSIGEAQALDAAAERLDTRDAPPPPPGDEGLSPAKPAPAKAAPDKAAPAPEPKR